MSSGPLAVPYAITRTPVDRSVTVHPSGLEGARIEARPDGLRGAPVGPARGRRRDLARRRGELGLLVVLDVALVLEVALSLDLGLRIAGVDHGLVVILRLERRAEGRDPGIQRCEPLFELLQPALSLGGTVGIERSLGGLVDRGGGCCLGLLGADLSGRRLVHLAHDGPEARLEIDDLQAEAVGKLDRTAR